jgi:hypothetical protein
LAVQRRQTVAVNVFEGLAGDRPNPPTRKQHVHRDHPQSALAYDYDDALDTFGVRALSAHSSRASSRCPAQRESQRQLG